MDYQSNSNKSKKKEDIPDKSVEKVIEGEVVVKKKPLGKRFAETFFGGDVKNALQYVLAEVLLPEARKLVVEMAWKGTERVVFGDSRARTRSPQYGVGTRYNYSASSNPFSHDPRDQMTRRRANLPDQPSRPTRGRIDDLYIVLASRAEAERVLEQLMMIIDKYQVTSVSDLNELVGLPTSHTDQNWGWDRLNDVIIRQVREGYLLDLPPADYIK